MHACLRPTLLAAIACLLSTCAASDSPYHNVLIDAACDTTTSVFVPWTGFRISRQWLPAGASVRYSFCYFGSEYSSTAHLLEPPDSQQWTPWAATFCIPRNPSVDIAGCYKMARLSKYAASQNLVLRPDTFVGGLFRCAPGSDCDNENAIPMLPLLTDEPYMAWHSSTPVIAQAIPLLYTPDQLSLFYPSNDTAWAAYIDVNEIYAQDESDVDVTKQLGKSFARLASLLSPYYSHTNPPTRDALALLGTLSRTASRRIWTLASGVNYASTNSAQLLLRTPI